MKSAASKTGLVAGDIYRRHVISPTHPESPRRLAAIDRKLADTGLISAITALTPVADRAIIDAAVAANHSMPHIRSVVDCSVTGPVALAAVGGALSAVDAVVAGTVRNAFCAVRPPGHHAHNNGADYDGPGEGQGFCFFNNIAIAARYAQKRHGCKSILILDWDYHHGNGTEWSFYDDPTFFFFSTHAWNTYPGTGSPDRMGAGAGLGYNLNVPLDPYANDADIIAAWERQLVPTLDKMTFKPDLVLISAGFDSRMEDYLGNFRVTDAGFVRLTEIAMDLAAHHCNGRLVSLLEGGYNPEGLADAVAEHVRALLEYRA